MYIKITWADSVQFKLFMNVYQMTNVFLRDFQYKNVSMDSKMYLLLLLLLI